VKSRVSMKKPSYSPSTVEMTQFKFMNQHREIQELYQENFWREEDTKIQILENSLRKVK